MHLQKSGLKWHHFFYISFFLMYLAAQYYFLYHVNGLQPFQYNIHFFANVIGSLSKRFLSEAAIYALIFYILFYDAKKTWTRLILIGIFWLIFLINTLAIGFYFVTRSNFQFYILEGFNWPIFLSIFTLRLTLAGLAILGVMGAMGYALFIIKSPAKDVWRFKKRLFKGLGLALALGLPFLPARYDDNFSVLNEERVQKKTYRAVDLETTGLSVLSLELRHHFLPPKIVRQTLTPPEQEAVRALHLDEQMTQAFENPPKKIVLVIAESLDQQFFSPYNPKLKGYTPNLEKLFQIYSHLDEFYPSGPYTLQGVSSIACGHTNGAQAQNIPAHECAPKLLAENGFKTELIRGASKYYVGENLHFSKFGFQSTTAKEEFEKKYPEFIEKRPELHKIWGYSDQYIFNEAIERLKQSPPDEKLFLTLLTVDTHVAGGRCSYERTEKDPEDNLLFSIQCFDRVFGEFVEGLKKENLLDENTLVILTADHLYPAFNRVPGAELNTSFVLKPGKIPFLMISKNPWPLKAAQGSHVDIAATLLDLANLEIPSYYMGKSLLSNPWTTPMGHDRVDDYVIVNGRFNPLSQAPRFEKEKGAKTMQLEVPAEATPEEIQELIQQKADEVYAEKNQEELLYKWYYNKFNNLGG